MDAEYKKAAEKLLCGITDKRLHEPTIWNDILSSVRSGRQTRIIRTRPKRRIFGVFSFVVFIR